MPKNTKRRSPAQIERDRRKIAEMYLQGRYQEEIAQELGIDQSTVSRDIKRLLESWRKETEADIEQRQKELEQKYLLVWREAFAAWKRSLEDAVTEIQEAIEGADSNGAKGKDRLKASTRREGQSGNPALLAQAQAALKAIREMLGIDKPVEQKITFLVEQELEKALDALEKRLPPDVYNAVVTALAEEAGSEAAEPNTNQPE